MEVRVLPSACDVAKVVADTIEALVASNPQAVLGFATGSSPLATYNELVERHRAGKISFAQTRGFLLDEYVGLPATHHQSYRFFIDAYLASMVDFGPGAIVGPNGTASDLLAECLAYEAAIAEAGGIDLQLLGIGCNGHIGFNEPTSTLLSRTRVIPLTDHTREVNARFFTNVAEVPRHSITQGIGTILDARQLVLIATGASKARVVRQAIEGPLTTDCPASALQLHQNSLIVLDAAAASELTGRY